jgi:hypothetical protein|tara:strand:- start:233 stop:502 length:270 start_codon:yes stop_codon:yes gene_type:complete
MRVSELKVGELYKIRSDRATTVTLGKDGILDVHLGNGHFKGTSKIRPFDHLVYLGKDHNNTRWVNYRGKKMRTYPNIWQHIVPLDDDIS